MVNLPVVGDGVIIDRLVPGDAPALSRSHSDPDNARFQGWQSPLSEDEALAFIRDHAAATPAEGVQLAIRERHGGELAGDLYLHRPDDADDVVEVGITLVPGFGGRGLATATIAAVASAVGALRAWVHEDNVRSRALFERLGFRLVEQEGDEVRYEIGAGECRVGRNR